MPDPELLFRLTPDCDSAWSMPQANGPSRVVPFHVSSQGLRDKVYGEKAEGTFRILCIGDSFTMGHGLENEQDTFPKQLEALLNARSKGGRVEVINAGVMAWGNRGRGCNARAEPLNRISSCFRLTREMMCATA